MNKKLLLILIGLAISFSYCFADTITLHSGRKIEGKIIEKNANYIRIETSGVEISYYHDEIKNIQISKDETFYENPSLKQPETALTDKPRNIKRTPSQIFKEFSPAIVLIRAKYFLGYKIGVGFIVSKDGLIVSAFETVGGTSDIQVELQNGRIYDVTSMTSYNPARNICVFKIDADNLPTVTLGDSDSLEPRDELIAITISPDNQYETLSGNYLGKKNIYGKLFIQNTIPFNNNDIGSPVFDAYGNLLGICSFTDGKMRDFHFAIPINEVKKYIAITAKVDLDIFEKQIGKAEVLLVNAKAAQKEGNMYAMGEFLKKAIALEPKFIKAHALLATVYLKTDKIDEAYESMQKALSLEKNYEKLYTDMTYIYILKHMPAKAMTSANKALKINPTYAPGYNALGAVYKISGLLDKAIFNYKKSITLAPNNCNVYNILIDILSKKKYCLNASKYLKLADKVNCKIRPDERENLAACR